MSRYTSIPRLKAWCASLPSGISTKQGIEARKKHAPRNRYVVREHDRGPLCASDADLLDFLRLRGGIAFHPVGTCKMGYDPLAVVDDVI
ncbi:MAG: hypothetical protein HY322_04200 [Betaproteobacteria bacterium]|nr:hypothetical protein [Betaproteobacteria bacterium]